MIKNTGYGIACYGCAARIANNAVVDNVAGVYVDGSQGCEILSNTIAYNDVFGIYLIGGDGDVLIANCIVAGHTVHELASEISVVDVEGSIDLANNDVHGNTTDYEGIDDPTDTNGNKSEDPEFVNPGNGDYHLSASNPTSPCKDAGDNGYVEECRLDIDGDYRIHDGTVDIGVDEITGCVWYTVGVTAEENLAEVEETITLTAHVLDPPYSRPVNNQRVDISVDAGEIVAISPGGHIDDPPTSGYGTTDANGNVQVQVTRDTIGRVKTTATTVTCGATASTSCPVWFGEGPVLVICLDTTQSVGLHGFSVPTRLNKMIDDLAAIAPIRLAGVKYRDDIQATYPLTTSVGDFKAWLMGTEFNWGDDKNEDALDALDECSQLAEGSYIALVTDAAFHYWGDNQVEYPYSTHTGYDCPHTTLTIADARSILSTAACKVYVDAGDGTHDPTAIGDYTDAKLHDPNDDGQGGAMEDTSFGSYTFPKLQAAITE